MRVYFLQVLILKILYNGQKPIKLVNAKTTAKTINTIAIVPSTTPVMANTKNKEAKISLMTLSS